MKSFPDGGVGQRGRRFGRQLVALRRQHGKRGPSQARVILEGQKKKKLVRVGAGQTVN